MIYSFIEVRLMAAEDLLVLSPEKGPGLKIESRKQTLGKEECQTNRSVSISDFVTCPLMTFLFLNFCHVRLENIEWYSFYRMRGADFKDG